VLALVVLLYGSYRFMSAGLDIFIYAWLIISHASINLLDFGYQVN